MRKTVIAPIFLAVLLLAGCATATADTVQKTPVTQQTATSPAHPADWEMCSQLMGGMDSYAALILKLAQTGTIDADKLQTVTDYIDALRADDSAASTAMVEAFAGPYDAITAALKTADPHVNFDTAGYKQASADLMTYCVDTVGYHDED